MHKGRVVFQSLHQVGLHRIFQQDGHRAICLNIACKNWAAVAAIGHDHITEAFLQIGQIFGQTENRHNLRGNGDVKTRFAWEAIGHSAQRSCDLPQRAVIHINNPAPHHAACVDVELIAPIDMVVDHRGQKTVRRGNCVKIACEMQVHIFHRHDLRIAAPGSATLHPKIRA